MNDIKLQDSMTAPTNTVDLADKIITILCSKCDWCWNKYPIDQADFNALLFRDIYNSESIHQIIEAFIAHSISIDQGLAPGELLCENQTSPCTVFVKIVCYDNVQKQNVQSNDLLGYFLRQISKTMQQKGVSSCKWLIKELLYFCWNYIKQSAPIFKYLLNDPVIGPYIDFNGPIWVDDDYYNECLGWNEKAVDNFYKNFILAYMERFKDNPKTFFTSLPISIKDWAKIQLSILRERYGLSITKTTEILNQILNQNE